MADTPKDRLDHWIGKARRFVTGDQVPERQGFEEAQTRAFADFEARLPPPGVETMPASQPKIKRGQLDPTQSAGGGYVTDDRGNRVPHYWGHRKRLRDRFLKGGADALPEYELLELLLFNAIERIDVKPLAKRLLATFHDLPGVVTASETNLLRVEGTTEKVVYQLRLAAALSTRLGQARIMQRELLNSSDALLDYCRAALGHRSTEQFRILFLDTKNMLIADEAQAEGTVNHVPVYPREVARRALELSASAVILVHNHPSGDTTPSRADLQMTDQIIHACAAIDVRVHDHLIISKTGFYSFRAEGDMV